MKFKNGLLICSIFLFFVIISSGIVFAEDSALPLVDSGEVSGGVDISSVNPFNSTSSELIYEIPEDVTEIRSANVVVSTYSGSGAPTYGLTTNISLNTNDKSEILEYANLTYSDSTASDPVIYPITNFTSKQYSDYQSLFDITEKVKGLSSGDTITVSVNNTALEGYSFDGRIKLIALIFAYDDGDNDKITYWLNVGQAWTKETLTTVFNTKEFDDEYSDVVLESIALSSADATYMLNGKLLLEPQQEKGTYYIYDVWNIGDKFELGNNTNLTYTSSKASTYSSYKASIQLLKINTPEKLIPTGVNKLVTEYTSVSTVQAGVENTLTLTVENDGTANATDVTVKVLLGNETLFEDVVANYDVGSSYKFSVIDPTIRDIDASTEFGANNTFADYTVVIEENGVEINSTDYSFPVRYNGNLGKDYEYPVVNSTEIVRFYDITGDVICVNSDDSAYMGTGATSRNETLTANFDGDVVDSLLYVSYNWDGVDSGDFNTWNVTFNNVAVTPIANYRDQGNLGNYGNKGYGLVVYNVSSLVKSGDNLVTISKNSGKSAVYPSSLLILTNNNESETTKNVYIAENADLLAKTYSKNLTVGANTQFNDLSLNRIINATLYVFAASAQNGEGNIIFNDVTSENVWNGTSNSINSYELDIMDIVDKNNLLFFESTGSTILALHQIIVVETENAKPTGVNKLVTEYTSVSTVQAGVENTLTLTVENDGTANATDVTVKVLLGNETLFEDVVANYDVGSSYKFSVIDPTIRDIDASTEFGANNTFADYTVVIEENGVEINSTDYSFPVRYNGNLGKDYEYPVVNSTEIVRFYDITGDVICVNSDDSAYMGTGATSRNETLTANFDGDVVDSLLYVSYNWDGVDSGDFNTWNVTFNNVAVTPIANYRDQGNLGNYGNKGYGLVVYNVSSLVKSGDNLVTISKNSGKSAVYPSSLLILTNNNESETTKNVYIAENADLLAKTYSKNLTVGANTQFNDLSLNRIINATLYVFAASAQNGEGNIIFNDVTSENVWNGTSNSINSYEMDITDIVDESNSLFFESTGSTILALHQIIVVEYESYIVVDAPDVEKYFKGSERFVVNVTDNKGNPISNKSVNITINGRSYIKTTDENGSASIALGLNSGTYNVTTIVDNETFDSVVSILSTVNGTDVVKVYKNGTQYYATFYDSEGNYLKNGTAVKFNINGVIYDRKVSGDKGLAKLNINLPEGEYVITAMNLETGENGVNNITVISKLIENKDITKYYRNATQYTVKVLGDDGNPVGAGENVTFNINGVFYTRTTNESGIAKLNLNLPPGDYVITAEYKGCKVSNNIKVLPVLSAEDITMKYRDGTKFVATLVDGQGKPYAEQTVQFNINGVLYNRVTDSSGQAKLNINLIAGQYIITSSYNGANIANTVTVTQ